MYLLSKIPLLTRNFDRQIATPMRINLTFFQLQPVRRLVTLVLIVALSWWSIGVPGAAEAIAATQATAAPVESIESSQTPAIESIGISSDTISSEKVSQFVDAYLQVLALIGQREADLQAAQTVTESQRLEQDIEAEAVRIIETTGLTQSEYLQLLTLANIDPDFGERIATQLQEKL
jgi:Domain of unknown function (DUF4168)